MDTGEHVWENLDDLPYIMPIVEVHGAERSWEKMLREPGPASPIPDPDRTIRTSPDDSMLDGVYWVSAKATRL